MTHAELVSQVMNVSLAVSTSLRMELDQLLSEMTSHRCVAQSLLQLSDDIRFMVNYTRGCFSLRNGC